MKNVRLPKNPFLLFLPFLFFYIIFIFILHNDVLWGDELRHMEYAKNLLQGFYSPPAPNIQIENGPGYPFVMVPFLALHLPFITLKLLNAFLLYLSIVMVFKVLLRFVSFRMALIFSLSWACYYNSLDFIALMYSEALGAFLISAFALSLIKAFESGSKIKNNKYVYIAGVVLGYLILTKVIFGYVLLCMLLGVGILWLMDRKSINYRKSMLVLLIAFASVIPYLTYTYSISGRLLYWATTGGNNLFWMTTTSNNEFGSWGATPQLVNDSLFYGKMIKSKEVGGALNLKNRGYTIPGFEDSVLANNGNDLKEILKYKGVEQDDAFKKAAINNIKTHPLKFLQNCFSNIGRILFNYPYSYTMQKPGTLIRLPLNGAILILMLFCAIPTLTNWKAIPFSIRFLLLFVLIYLGGSVLGSAEIRMFTVIVPVLLIWIAFVIEKSMRINWKWK